MIEIQLKNQAGEHNEWYRGALWALQEIKSWHQGQILGENIDTLMERLQKEKNEVKAASSARSDGCWLL